VGTLFFSLVFGLDGELYLSMCFKNVFFYAQIDQYAARKENSSSLIVVQNWPPVTGWCNCYLTQLAISNSKLKLMRMIIYCSLGSHLHSIIHATY